MPVYVDGSSNQLYAETGEALMRFEGRLLPAWAAVEALAEVTGRTEEVEGFKEHFQTKGQDFLALLGAAEAA